jgi:hypothetical protein
VDGPSSYLTKVTGVVVNMDNMISKEFETGLANLKAVAESRHCAQPSLIAGRSGRR